MVDHSDVSALLLLAAALSLFVVAGVSYPHAGAERYGHSVDSVDSADPGYDVPADVTPRPFESLSPKGKRAFLDGLDGDGVVYGEPNRPPDFVYTDAPNWGDGMYLISYEGTRYALLPQNGPFGFVDQVAFLALLALGSSLAAAGGFRLCRSPARVSTGALLGGGLGFGCLVAVAVSSTVRTGWIHPWLVGGIVVAVTAAGAVLTAGLTGRYLAPKTP
ncbi:hypothetical protein ACFO0N_03845 [Halobium salinum]|uniref:DUF7979 domain-containing protein n=1 Tax=Halobium salinum TaxID=1364940 RepID=A0ABD5P877_9EURY|nr:hypothetical protein [Halobium salinum]